MTLIARRIHTDREFEMQLEELRRGLIVMAGRVEAMIADACTALVERDADLAADTIREDGRVNLGERRIDELCRMILARWQPMGGDLRFITRSLKMVTDLERIGDLAVNICERAIDMSVQAPLKSWRDVPVMSEHVQSMIREAIDAFVAYDADKARAVIKRDDVVDELYTQIFREVLDIMRVDPTLVERGIHVLSVAKWLERMADHATNLAEQLIFMIEGEDVRHAGARTRVSFSD